MMPMRCGPTRPMPGPCQMCGGTGLRMLPDGGYYPCLACRSRLVDLLFQRLPPDEGEDPDYGF